MATDFPAVGSRARRKRLQLQILPPKVLVTGRRLNSRAQSAKEKTQMAALWTNSCRRRPSEAMTDDEVRALWLYVKSVPPKPFGHK
jgi:hypothetical protein